MLCIISGVSVWVLSLHNQRQSVLTLADDAMKSDAQYCDIIPLI